MTIAQPNSNLYDGKGFNEMVATGEVPYRKDLIPSFEIKESRYVVRLARTPEEIDAALRLRFEVFNVELGEGLDASYITGRDEDKFDANCHHLIVLESETGDVVGTYRLQTLEMAGSAFNFYCAGEFELENLPAAVLAQALEIGRACITREHRNTRVLFLLWKGLSAYARETRKRYLFGCCSLTSQNPAEGIITEKLLRNEDHFHPNFHVLPHGKFICKTESFTAGDIEKDAFELPKLFRTYLRFGAKVCSPPALDREFKTIDFLVLFDFAVMDEKHRQMF